MKVSEYLTQEQTTGFFPVMENAYPETYQKLFGTIDPTLLDTRVGLLYGERELIAALTNETATNIIKSVIIVNADSWVKQANALNAVYDVLQPVTSKQVTTISETTTESNNNTDTKQSTTFNDSTFGDDERNEQTGTGNRTGEKTQTIENSGNGSGAPVSEIIKKEINLRKISLQKQVVNDLMSELILSIY